MNFFSAFARIGLEEDNNKILVGNTGRQKLDHHKVRYTGYHWTLVTRGKYGFSHLEVNTVSVI